MYRYLFMCLSVIVPFELSKVKAPILLCVYVLSISSLPIIQYISFSSTPLNVFQRRLNSTQQYLFLRRLSCWSYCVPMSLYDRHGCADADICPDWQMELGWWSVTWFRNLEKKDNCISDNGFSYALSHGCMSIQLHPLFCVAGKWCVLCLCYVEPFVLDREHGKS